MNLKRIIEIFPLLGSFLILLGYLKLYLYYDHWNIAIIDYLDISEITLLFLSDVHIIIAFIAIYIFPVTLGLMITKWLDNEPKPLHKENDNHTKDKQDESITDAIDTAVTKVGENRFLFFVGLLLPPVIFIIFFFIYNKIWLLYFSIFGFMQFVQGFSDYIFNERKKAVTQVTFVTTAFAFAILVTHYDVRKTEVSPSKYEIAIVLNDTTINTSKELLYLGKTNQFVFLFDSKNRLSRTIKTEVVKEILIKEK